MGIMNVETAQAELDKRFPQGVHVWVGFGNGSDPATFLVPRVFVLDDHTLLVSPMDGTRYFEVEVDDLVFKDKRTAVIESGTRSWTLTPATETAQLLLKDRLEGAHRKGLAEEFRSMRASVS